MEEKINENIMSCIKYKKKLFLQGENATIQSA